MKIVVDGSSLFSGVTRSKMLLDFDVTVAVLRLQVSSKLAHFCRWTDLLGGLSVGRLLFRPVFLGQNPDMFCDHIIPVRQFS